MNKKIYKMNAGSVIALLHLCLTSILVFIAVDNINGFGIDIEKTLMVLWFPLGIIVKIQEKEGSPFGMVMAVCFVSILSAYLWGYGLSFLSKGISMFVKKNDVNT